MTDSIIPFGLYKPIDFAGIAAAVAASVGYAGANGFLLFENNSADVAIIPANSIMVSTDQVCEAVATVYSGAPLVTPIWVRYQMIEANFGSPLQLREVVLKPGERLLIRVFNRAPAAPCDIAFGSSYYTIQQAIYDQIISRKRAQFESMVV